MQFAKGEQLVKVDWFTGFVAVILVVLLGLTLFNALQPPPNEYPPPTLRLPYVSKDEVVSVPQMWNPPNHVGIDFKGKMDTRFVAVCNGEITSITK